MKSFNLCTSHRLHLSKPHYINQWHPHTAAMCRFRDKKINTAKLINKTCILSCKMCSMLPFLEAELDPPSAFVRTMIGLLFTAFPAFVDNSKFGAFSPSEIQIPFINTKQMSNSFKNSVNKFNHVFSNDYLINVFLLNFSGML